MRIKIGFLSVIALVMTLFITTSCSDYDYNSGIESLVQNGTWKLTSLYDENLKEDVDLESETTLTFGWDKSFTATGYFRDYSGGTWSLYSENYNTSRGLNCRFEDYTNSTATVYIYDGNTKYVAKAVLMDKSAETATDSDATN